MTKFVDASNNVFSSYVNYMDRDNATRNDNRPKYILSELQDEINQFNSYLDYMDNPEKTTELFTSDKDNLNENDKQLLKNALSIAQKNNSIMWQTVISFDNRWLAKNNVYNPVTHELDEKKIKECARGCMNTILDKELIKDSSIWSGAIHYNTDSIHVHISTVEPIPTRKMKKLNIVQINKEWLDKNQILSDGILNKLKYRKNGVTRKNRTAHAELGKRIADCCNKEYGGKYRFGHNIEYINGNINISYLGDANNLPPIAKLIESKEIPNGKFKQSSIDSGKRYVVNNILSQQLENQKINDIIRKDIIQSKKENPLTNDTELCQIFLDIYKRLPSDRRQWQYNMSQLKPLRPMIDRLSKLYIQKYHREEFANLKKLLTQQESKYKEAYGAKYSNNYANNKLSDLYTRMGNSILKEMKEFSKEMRDKKETHNETDFNKSEVKQMTENPQKEHSESPQKLNQEYSYQKNHTNKSYSLFLLERAMNNLKKTLCNDFEHKKNQFAYEQLQQEIENEI